MKGLGAEGQHGGAQQAGHVVAVRRIRQALQAGWVRGFGDSRIRACAAAWQCSRHFGMQHPGGNTAALHQWRPSSVLQGKRTDGKWACTQAVEIEVRASATLQQSMTPRNDTAALPPIARQHLCNSLALPSALDGKHQWQKTAASQKSARTDRKLASRELSKLRSRSRYRSSAARMVCTSAEHSRQMPAFSRWPLALQTRGGGRGWGSMLGPHRLELEPCAERVLGAALWGLSRQLPCQPCTQAPLFSSTDC